MNWVKKRKLPATKAIKYNGSPYLSPDSLWTALHNFFNTALHHQVNVNILNKIEYKPHQIWNPFSKFEFRSAIQKCVDVGQKEELQVPSHSTFHNSFHH